LPSFAAGVHDKELRRPVALTENLATWSIPTGIAARHVGGLLEAVDTIEFRGHGRMEFGFACDCGRCRREQVSPELIDTIQE
jgi:hypothetical protein